MDTREKIDVCDVHKYALGDTSKRRVLYCSDCNAWICDECRPNVMRRAKAMLVRSYKDITGAFSSVVGASPQKNTV